MLHFVRVISTFFTTLQRSCNIVKLVKKKKVLLRNIFITKKLHIELIWQRLCNEVNSK